MDDVFLNNKDKSKFNSKYFFLLEDIKPQANIHLLLIPHKKYKDFLDFSKNSTNEEKIDFFNCVEEITKDFNGFRLITNNGVNAGQVIFHFHFHILSGLK